MTRGKPTISLMTKLMTMKKPLLLALFATGACCALGVSAIHSKAHAQDASRSCNTECLVKQIDVLNKRSRFAGAHSGYSVD
jgi:hypothetical protein